MFNKYKSWLVSVSSEINDNNNMIINNNNNDNKEKENNEFKYTKIIVENPYYNRDTILKITKKQKGVYI
jgi:hypothetical protein